MNIYDLLFEDRASFIATAAGNKLVQLAQQETNQQYTPQQIVSQLAKGDPTKNQQYLQWITNQYLKKQFRLEDMSRIHDELSKFDKVKNKLDIKDINKYDYYALADQVDKIYNQASIKAPQQATDSAANPDVKVLYNGPLGTLSIPLTQAASCELGKGTKWCTAASKGNLFNKYNDRGPLYIWRDKSGQKFQFHFKTRQFMDDKDRPISDQLLNEFRTKHPILSKLFKQQEAEIIKDPEQAYWYARKTINGRWPEAEPYIMKDPEVAIQYTQYIIKDRWPEAEPYIMKDGNVAYWYTYYFIKGRWPEAEPYIMKNASTAWQYALHVIKGRWPEAEPYIMKHPDSAALYALHVIKGRWPEAEPYIMKDVYAADKYKEAIRLDDKKQG